MAEDVLDSEPAHRLRHVDRAIAELRRGELVLLTHDGATLAVIAAETLTSEDLARLARLTLRQLSLALSRRRAAVLGLGPAPQGPGGTVVIPIPEGSEVEFLRELADPASHPGAPPDGGVATVPQPAADAAVELMKLARLLPAAMLGPVAPRMAAALARDGVHTVQSRDVMAYQQDAAQSLRAVAEARVPLADAENTRIIAFRPSDGGTGHIAIVIGAPDPAQPALVRLHSECFTGDLLGSLRCDCGDQLRGAIAEIARSGAGILLYLAQEGRGIGLVNKLRAYNLQDAGLDTFDANEQLGFDADERVYLPAAEMLRQLGFARVRLMTNNPGQGRGARALRHRGGRARAARLPGERAQRALSPRQGDAPRPSALTLPGRFCRPRAG